MRLNGHHSVGHESLSRWDRAYATLIEMDTRGRICKCTSWEVVGFLRFSKISHQCTKYFSFALRIKGVVTQLAALTSGDN
jgi:hypothetical protein